MKSVFLSILCLGLSSCRTLLVTPSPASDAVKEGITYKLPKTQLLIEINVKTTTYSKSGSGCFDEYRQYFKGLVSSTLLDKIFNAKDKDYVSFKIGDVVLSPMPVSDDTKIFTIQNKNKGTYKHVTGVSLDDNGVLTKGDFSSENQVVPLVSQLISSTAGFISPFTSLRASDEEEPTCLSIYNKYIETDDLKRSFSGLTQFKLSNALPSKEVYDGVLAELEKQKLGLFDRLMFSTDIRNDKIVIRFTPTKEDRSLVNGKILFGFEKQGEKAKLHINQDLIGPFSAFVVSSPGVEIVGASADDLEKNENKWDIYKLAVVPVSANVSTVRTYQADPDKLQVGLPASNTGGIYYNIPLNCKVYLRKGNQNFSEATMMFPQWGTLGQTTDKSIKQTIELNPLYGNLKSVSQETQGITRENVKSLGESISQARDVFYTDPVTRMERRIKFLETQGKLTEAEGTELTELRKQIELLKAQKEEAELKKALKDLE